MEKRTQELIELHEYVSKVDTETSLVLQSLQWDRGRFLQGANMVECSYNKNHKVPEQSKDSHEKECFFKTLGYVKEDLLLPDYTASPADNCVKFSYEEVKEIIETAARNHPQFHRGVTFGSSWTPPLSASRLRSTYTTDERRVLYDAIIQRAPPPSISESMFVSTQDQSGGTKQKSRLELLAEQRDMKRRRAKYRVATKSKNYSQVLHEVIRNQMELYSEVQTDKIKHGTTQRRAEPADKTTRPRQLNSRHEYDKQSRETKYCETTTDQDKYRNTSRNKDDARSSTSTTLERGSHHKSSDRCRSRGRKHKMDESEHQHRGHSSSKHHRTHRKDDKYERRSRYR